MAWKLEDCVNCALYSQNVCICITTVYCAKEPLEIVKRRSQTVVCSQHGQWGLKFKYVSLWRLIVHKNNKLSTTFEYEMCVQPEHCTYFAKLDRKWQNLKTVSNSNNNWLK